MVPTSILVNLPGEAASVVTTLDGYQMAKQGRAGAALAAAAIGSFFAGTVATFLIAGFGPPLAAVALKFGPAEFFSLMVLGLVASVVLAQGLLLHAIGMVVLGLLLGLIGTDVNSGTQRFTFGIYELADGIGFVTVAMGMFGLGEIIRNLENEEELSVMVTKITGLWPTREDFKRMVAPILRGTLIGSALGFLCRLLHRKEGLKKSRAVRQGGDRRCRRAGVGQQRRRANFLYPVTHIGDSVKPSQRIDGRSDDHSRYSTWPFGDQ
jgi:putative tricarboxylic transport membrane protein